MTPDMPKDIVNELRVHATIEQISGTIFERAADEIERLRKERDEARQEICIQKCDSLGALIGGSPKTPQDYAKKRGWDCFKEDTNE
jgi:hypothetical protein